MFVTQFYACLHVFCTPPHVLLLEETVSASSCFESSFLASKSAPPSQKEGKFCDKPRTWLATQVLTSSNSSCAVGWHHSCIPPLSAHTTRYSITLPSLSSVPAATQRMVLSPPSARPTCEAEWKKHLTRTHTRLMKNNQRQMSSPQTTEGIRCPL